jgi:hypothetical protein
MSVFVSGTVRRTCGEAQVARLLDALPECVECRVCGELIELADERVSLSMLMVGPVSITAWSHRTCAGSRVLTDAQFRADRRPDHHVLTDQERARIENGPGQVIV